MTFKIIYKGKRYIGEIFRAHNGIEIITITSTEYVHTEFDEIISSYREQQAALRRAISNKQQTVSFWSRLLKKCA